jgi:tetratricopeptide (TPR) repeat protein
MDRSRVGHAPRWIPIAGTLLVTAVAGVVVWTVTHPSMSACEREVRFGDQARGVDICLQHHARTADDQDLVWAAKARMQLASWDGAEAIAAQLIHGPRYGDGHVILSYVAERRGAVPAARMHATIARIAHQGAGDDHGVAKDLVLLSQAAWKAGDFTAALDAADDAVRLTGRLGDAHAEVVAYMARADALRRMGDTRAAAAALATATDRATEPCDKAWTRVKIGMCSEEAGQQALARLELAAAAGANRSCGSEDVALQIAINEAWLLRREDPAGALARLDEAAQREGEDATTLLLRGYLAADRGALADAERYLARAADEGGPDADWAWEIAAARAELAELRGGLFGDMRAEYHYRRAIAMVASLRGTARARSAYLVASHRAPYDGLIALLARHGRWRDALAVVLELDASDMLRATASGVASRDRAALALDIDAPGSGSTAPEFRVSDVLTAWRSRELVIVIAPAPRQIGPGHEQAYRLRIADGEVTGEAVADAARARTWADALFVDPGDRGAARELARAIVPAGPDTSALHVLAIGSLGKVPLAALRDREGALIIARRPLVRVLALAATGPESTGAGPPAVIADPRGTLLRAALEGVIVAQAIGPGVELSGAATGVPATRARLWAASNAASLHIAGHIGVAGRWPTLPLADAEVDPIELVHHRVAPRIAVLAGCGSAAATDTEGWGSIAAALLQSGTAVVIATDRSVRDDDALSIMLGFYAQPDWRADPARALARVQDARAASRDGGAMNPASWAAFTILARPPEVPERRTTR